MRQLDAIDKRIIYELGRDARQSYKEIARCIKSKKEIVAYHVQDLLKSKVITKFVPVFSLTPLGVYSFKIYLRLHGLNKEAEEQLYSRLMGNPDIIWVAKAVGQWDLLIALYSTDIVSFSRKKDEILSSFSPYIESYDVTMIEDALVFNRDYLVENRNASRTEFVFGGPTERVHLDNEEKRTLQLIKNDGRFQVVNIGKTLNEDPRTTLARIKRLQKKGIIQGYTVFLDLQKIGFQLHKLCIYLATYEKQDLDRFIERVKQIPEVIHLIKSLGSWEYEIELEANSLQTVHETMRLLKNEFPKLIKKIEYLTITEEPKIEFFPQTLVELPTK